MTRHEPLTCQLCNIDNAYIVDIHGIFSTASDVIQQIKQNSRSVVDLRDRVAELEEENYKLKLQLDNTECHQVFLHERAQKMEMTKVGLMRRFSEKINWLSRQLDDMTERREIDMLTISELVESIGTLQCKLDALNSDLHRSRGEKEAGRQEKEVAEQRSIMNGEEEMCRSEDTDEEHRRQRRESQAEPLALIPSSGLHIESVREESTLRSISQETFAQIRNLSVQDTIRELLLRLVLDQKYAPFQLQDLVKAVESCGDLAYDDDKLLVYLSSKCKKCGKSEPRHYQLAMSQCSCQLCNDCFRQFIFKCINRECSEDPLRFACPGCHLPKPGDTELFVTHLNFLNLQLEEIGLTSKWVNQMVALDFKRATDECCEQLKIKKGRYDTLTPLQTAYEMLNSQGFKCPKCSFRYPGSKSFAASYNCFNCKCTFCPCCGGLYKNFMQQHDDYYHFMLTSVPLDMLKSTLKKANILFERKADKTRPTPVTKHGACKAVDFKQESPGSGDFNHCPNQIQDGISVCERHYREYLVDLIKQNKLSISAANLPKTLRFKLWFYDTMGISE